VPGSSWINAFDDFSENVGVVSYAWSVIEMVNNAQKYPYDPFKQAVSVGIDCLNVIVSTSITSALVGYTGGSGALISPLVSVFCDEVFGYIKYKILN
ncbi:MAG: hypothetical protein IK955_06080, partial [Clostridia bacterium]|nr:hypothetical protein [Clostridia bacterium]MBP3938958.1 hypothetical protein [Clostridia bacterium]